MRHANFCDSAVELREGDALQTLSADLPDKVDLVLLDGAKALYPDILKLMEPHLRAGAFIIADNADHSPEYLARVRARDGGYVSTAFGDEVEVTTATSVGTAIPTGKATMSGAR